MKIKKKIGKNGEETFNEKLRCRFKRKFLKIILELILIKI